MKLLRTLQKITATSLVAAGLMLAGSRAQAITNITAWTFDTAIPGWTITWGGQGNCSWDGAQDANGNAGSGSLKVVDTWGNGDQLVCLGWFSGSAWWNNPSTVVDLTLYTNISFKVKWDAANSTVEIPSFNSTQEGLALWAVPADNSAWITVAYTVIPNTASNGWVKVNVPINPTTPGLSTVYGLGFKKWTGNGYTGTGAFWVDDIEIQAAVAPPAPPTVSAPIKATQGLNVIASTAGNSFYDRQSVRLVPTTDLSWIGRATVGNPVSYSFTIKDFPTGAASYGAEAYLFLAPGPTQNDMNFLQAPDWNNTNCVVVMVQEGAEGGIMRFQYKVNEDNNNAMYNGGTQTVTDSVSTNYWSFTNAPGSLPGGPVFVQVSPGVTNVSAETGNLGSVTNSSPLGTWTVTFTSDTNIKLTAPNGNISSFVLPANIASKFSDVDGFYVYLGMQANNAASLNRQVVYSNFSISGIPSPISQNFQAQSVLDNTTWIKTVSAGQAGVLIVPTNAPYWIQWTLPDGGYSLETAGTLTGSSWTSPTSFASGSLVGKRQQLVATSDLASPNSAAYFRLVKRVFSKLQVLLPGETNAPNTLTGKIGTPDPVSLGAGGFVNVTINAVDATYHIVNGANDTINLSSTDGAAIMPLDAGLVNGTLTQIVQFASAGSWTVTATNMTTVMPAVASSSVTVTP